MSKITEMLASVFMVLLASIFTLMLVEIAANIFVTKFASPEQFNRYASWRQLEYRHREEGARVSTHRYLGYYPTPGWEKDDNRHNSLGYRGLEVTVPKPPGEFRIVCLGGSTTYTSVVSDHRLSYPAQLQEHLRAAGFENVTVVNAGLYDYTTWEMLINFQFRVLDLEPDLVIVYHGINDIQSRLVWPPEAYRGDNSGARTSQSGIFVPRLLEYSTLARILLIKTGFANPHSTLGRVFISRPGTSYIDDWDTQTTSQTYPSGIFTEVTPEEMLAANPPIYYRRNLENLIAIAEPRNIGVILATMAYRKVSPQVNNRGGSPLFWTAMDEHNQVVREVAAETTAHLLDFASVFPPDEDLYDKDGIHLIEKGANEKARIFAEFIESIKLIPRSP
jgi:lysophospholipase L1-like esterase